MNKYHGTVKEFLEAGHRFIEGDVCSDGAQLRQITNPSRWNAKGSTDDHWFVVYAACLNKEPEPEYELVNCGFESFLEAVKSVINGDKLYNEDGHQLVFGDCRHGLYLQDDECDVLIDEIYRRVPLRTKTATYPMPETKAPEHKTEYFSVDAYGEVGLEKWYGSEYDFERLKAGNVFLNREHAQAKANAQAVEIEE